MWPWLLRPARFGSGRSRDFSGLDFVISEKVETDMARRPGEVGLYFFTGIGLVSLQLAKEVGNTLARLERHNRLFPGTGMAAPTFVDGNISRALLFGRHRH